MSFFRILLLAFVIFFTASCRAETNTPEAVPVTNEDETEVPYPFSTENNNVPIEEQPYPMETSYSLEENFPESLTIPAPTQDKGIVTGFLVTGSKEPYLGTIYLAKAIPASIADYPPLVAFSDQTDPKAVQDVKGRFLFEDIAPGEYAIAIWNPVSSFILQELGTENFLLFNVEAGKVTDLGEVIVP
jgi:hypothetical protein